MSWDIDVAAKQAPWQGPGGVGQLLVVRLPHKDASLSANTMACLNAQDLQRASKFARSKDAIRYMASRAALRSALAGTCNCAPHDVPLTTQEHGKPILKAATGAMHFNVTHSDAWALIVLHPDQAMGIDLEVHRPIDGLDELALSVCSARERVDWMATAPADRLTALYRTWARKEACLKAIGTGLLTPAQQVDMGLSPSPSHGSWRSEDGRNVWWTDLGGLPITDEHSACVAWCTP